jgi:hypothetical protein
MAKRKTSSKLKPHEAKKVWALLLGGADYKSIGESVGYTSTAIKLYANRKFKQEATKLWGEEVRKVGRCEIPGCTRTDDLNAHHLLEKSVWTHLRFDLSNGVCLCSGHHMMDRDICAHGSLPATEAFLDWLQDERRGQWTWYQEHKLDKLCQDVDYEQEYWNLNEKPHDQ